MDTSIQKLLKMKKFIFWINAHTPIKKQSSQDWNIPIHLKNNAPHIKLPLVSYHDFQLCFHHQLWVKWYVYILAIVLVIFDELICNSPNVCGCLTLNEMQIKLASLIISLTNNNLTNSSSTLLSEIIKKKLLYIVHIIILCTSTETSIYWEFKG